MPGKRQKYTREYKIEAVRLSMEPGKTAAQAAAELGIPAGQLYKWKREYEREGNTAFPGNGVVNSRDEELHRLRRELKRVTEERDFLKKTAADSIGQCNSCFSVAAGVLYDKVFLGRSFRR